MNDSQSPPDQPSLPISQDEHIDRLADAFEHRWKTGDRAAIEDYLIQIGPASRAALLGELVALEIKLRRGAGEVVNVDEYRRRFPDDAATVAAAFGVQIFPSTYVVVSQDDTGGHPAASSPPDVMPKTLGRYEVRRVLGHGGFGMVYLGHDTQLNRPVALKVPRKASFSPDRIEAFIREARMAAQLKHAGLVAVYDVQPYGDVLYIVQEYVDGRDLAHCAASRRFSHEEIVRVTIEIAEAIGFAHQRNLVHRDLKPANVLIDQEGRVHVADFGLALDEGLQRRREGEIAGTPAYMSPEQARGESHRLDGRTDLWSLGVILYELLTGRRPFAGKNRDELFDEIEYRDPKPPRMLDGAVPAELELICLKCLAKPRTLRYSSAAELLDDLRHWQAEGKEKKGKRREGDDAGHEAAGTRGHGQPPPLAKIVPKGLRCFDAHDADFFLELLPGPHDRDGLPPVVRFWKTLIEETDAERTFPVGVVWGPSGCGKSSLIRAGLLPRLASHVLPLYVEATAADTEVRLLKGLRKQCPELSADGSLAELIAQLRDAGGSRGRKVLVVLDQFEQWLHTHDAQGSHQLVRALRQCDGAAVQCLLMVRDDFCTSINRFMQALETPWQEGRNSAAVDLFDTAHARKVLAAFGRAYGRVGQALQPDVIGHADAVASASEAGEHDLNNQERFLDTAVAGLAEEGRVISVRLALFAEMMKGRPWTPACLDEAGGAEGVGVTFLENTFSAKTAPPTHRLHQAAAREVLKALLPASGADIKGQMKSHDALLSASGYERRPADFAELLRILDSELRLITATEPDQTAGSEAAAITEGPKYYQLTHDYLVPSLRDWLTRKQRETRRGRAELRLAERAASYAVKPDPRHLPGWFEWPNILIFTRRKNWTPPERRLVRAATRRRLLQGAVTGLMLAAAVVVGLTLRRRIDDERQRTVAQGLVAKLLVAPLGEAVKIADELAPYWRWADPLLRAQLDDPEMQVVVTPTPQDQAGGTARPKERSGGTPTPQSAVIAAHRVRASLGLLPIDHAQATPLGEALLVADADEAIELIKPLGAHAPALTQAFWRAINDAQRPAGSRLRAAMALAAFDPPGRTGEVNRVSPQFRPWEAVAPFVVGQMLKESRDDPSQYEPVVASLVPAAPVLVAPLATVFHDGERETTDRELAASILARYAKDDPATLANLAADATPKQFHTLFPVLQSHGAEAVAKLQAVLDDTVEPTWNEPPLDAAWTQPPAAAQAAIEAAHGILAERFAFCQDLAWDEFAQLAESLRPSGYRPTRVRPWQHGDKLLVAAVWTRDGKRWELEKDLAQEQLPQGDAPAEKDGLAPADLAVLPSLDPAEEPRFVLLWGEPAVAGEQRRPVVDAGEQQLVAAQAAMVKQGFAAQSTIGVWTDTAGQRHYLGIWSNQGAPSELRAAYGGFELVDQPQWDVAVARAAKLADPLDAFRQQLAEIAKLPPAQLDQPQVRLIRGKAEYHLGQFEGALADLDFLVEKKVVSPDVLQYRAWTLARLGKAQEALAELAKYLEQTNDAATRAYVQVVLAAWLGEQDQAAELLNGAATEAAASADGLYNAACAAGLASQACAASDAQRAAMFLGRAIELVEAAVAQGYQNAGQLRSDVDLAVLHGDSRFLAILERLEPAARYAAVWRADVEFESRLVDATSPDSQLEQARALAAQGYRPVSTCVIGQVASEGGSQAEATVSTIWHRPLIPDAAKEALAERQSTAAAALLRMGQTERVWPLFEHRSDPRLRSYLVDRLARYGADPSAVLARLQSESDVSRRRALILGIGQFARANLLSTEQQSAAVRDLAGSYADDADAGIHGAAEWTLRQLEAQAEIDQVRQAFATGSVVGERQWYVTKEGAQTLVIVRPEEEFLMGSPVAEAERFQGPTGKNEIRHRRRIGRTFAIGAHEVTVEQFQRFRAEHSFDRTKAREPDAPANLVSWYDAAAFCNWLSEQEGIGRDQWCYNPDQPFGDGMVLYPDYLRRAGYRLSSEAEWEYACRAGATTARYFGETDRLLGEYAWYTKNSQDRWMLPVGSLKPNDLGLFDTLGNVLEWCQEVPRLYSRNRTWIDDQEQADAVRYSDLRVLRGGAFFDNSSNVRSANRLTYQPTIRPTNFGFRVARTYP